MNKKDAHLLWTSFRLGDLRNEIPFYTGMEVDVTLPKVRKEKAMPKTAKGRKIMAAMKKQYGAKKGTAVFYASRNKGTIKGVDKRSGRKR